MPEIGSMITESLMESWPRCGTPTVLIAKCKYPSTLTEVKKEISDPSGLKLKLPWQTPSVGPSEYSAIGLEEPLISYTRSFGDSGYSLLIRTASRSRSGEKQISLMYQSRKSIVGKRCCRT